VCIVLHAGRTKPLPIGAGMAKKLRHKNGGRNSFSDDAALRVRAVLAQLTPLPV